MSDTPRTDTNSVRFSTLCADLDQWWVSRETASQLERDLNAAKALITELEARCKRLEEAARAVYLDSIASDHPWSEMETRNMHALRDVLETKP